MALLIPLLGLAFLGSRELARLEDQAETYLRGRASDFLATAVREFDDGIREFGNTLLDETLDRTDPDLVAASLRCREQHPDMLALLVLDGRGNVVYPRAAPSWTQETFPLGMPRRELRAVQETVATGDLTGAITALEAALEPPAAADGRGGDARARLRMQLQLAACYRANGELQRALAKFGDVRADAAAMIGPVGERDRRGRTTRTRSRGEAESMTLLAALAWAELMTALSGDGSELLRVVRELGAGQHPGVGDRLQRACLDRAVAFMLEHGAGAAELAEAVDADRRLAHFTDSRVLIRDLYAQLYRRLPAKLRRAAADETVYAVFDTDLATCLLILERVTADVGSLREGQWIGIVVDLTGYTNSRLADLLSPRDDGFCLDVRAPDGERVLRHELPPSSIAGDEILQRSTVAGLEFRALAQDPDRQLENRRAATRNRALLVLALCLVAVGGAFFLVRSVGREADLATMKVDLVSRVSHELKTPLAMIKMYGETLAMGRARDGAQTAKFAGIISREADRLTLLIERILDFSQQQSGSITYNRQLVDLAELVRGVTDEYRPHLESQGVELVTRIAAGTPVELDAQAAASALVNLLENAAKYTPTESADRRIEVELRRQTRVAVLEVMDRGVGIPPAERDRVFQSFYRASTAGEVRGAGLGLSLVQHFAIAHDGDIEALPRQGGGTVFRITLPLAEEPESADEQRP